MCVFSTYTQLYYNEIHFMKKVIIFDLEGTLVDLGGSAFSIIFIKEATLVMLVEEYELAIVTGASREQLEYVLDNSFLGTYFKRENTVTKDEVPEPKKTGLPFQYFLQRKSPQKSVILGDSEGDRLGSEVLGIPFVQINTTQLLNDPDFMSEYIKEAVLKLK